MGKNVDLVLNCSAFSSLVTTAVSILVGKSQEKYPLAIVATLESCRNCVISIQKWHVVNFRQGEGKTLMKPLKKHRQLIPQ